MPWKSKARRGAAELEHRAFSSLQNIFTQVAKKLPEPKGNRDYKKVNVVIAFSGGCDSVSLLNLFNEFKDIRKGEVTVVHVNHGLSPNADSWAVFAEKTAKDYGFAFVLKKVTVGETGLGIEAEARKKRYQALEEVAEQVKANLILTAHHRDDQLETFLIQWMRGAGIEGLACMPALSEDPIPIGRPLLSISRDNLESYAKSKGLSWVDDESNEDTSYLRNLIRLKVLPILDEARPGFRNAASRSIQLLADSASILKKEDLEDFQVVSVVDRGERKLNVQKLNELSPERKSRVLRHYLKLNGIQQIPESRLNALLRSLQDSEGLFRRLMTIKNKELVINRGLLIVQEWLNLPTDFEFIFNWEGQDSIEVPELKGRLLFIESNIGFDFQWLKAKPLSISLRKGKDRMLLDPNRPAKTIKVLCQEAGLTEGERQYLPILRRDGRIIFAEHFGLAYRPCLKNPAGTNIMVRWEPYEREKEKKDMG